MTELLLPDDAGYDEARRTQNDAVDRRPAVIARCADVADVQAALRLASEAALPVRVRGGGHGADRFAVDDDALVIDLWPTRGVRVDGRRAFVQGGATWRELDAATQAHGLAVTGARIPSVGVAGFTLGSGSGWLERKLGLAADSLVGAKVVTAGGEEVSAEGELLWALRGGGPSLGVVVELEFALHPVGDVTAGMLGWPVDRAAEVAAAYEALMAEAPDDLGGPLGQRDARWMWQAGAAWFESAQDDAVQQWAASLRAALAPWSHGEPYPNFIPGAEPSRLNASYGPQAWERLRAVRAQWDPENVLSGGHAIPLEPVGAR